METKNEMIYNLTVKLIDSLEDNINMLHEQIRELKSHNATLTQSNDRLESHNIILVDLINNNDDENDEPPPIDQDKNPFLRGGLDD
jgi:regulator of replication initiation timing